MEPLQTGESAPNRPFPRCRAPKIPALPAADAPEMPLAFPIRPERAPSPCPHLVDTARCVAAPRMGPCLARVCAHTRNGRENELVLAAALREHAVLVRHFNKPRTAPYLRITGTEDDVPRLIAAAVLILGHE